MKRYLLVAVIATLLTVSVAASEHGERELPEVAVTEDHPLYDAKLAAETGVEDLSASDREETEAVLEHSDRRVAEMENMAERGESSVRAFQGYENQMEKIDNLGERVSDSAQRQEIDELVAEATGYHREVLAGVMEIAPEEAQQGIQNAMDRAERGQKEAAERASRNLVENARESLSEGNQDLESDQFEEADQKYAEAQDYIERAEELLIGLDDADQELVQDVQQTRESASQARQDVEDRRNQERQP